MPIYKIKTPANDPEKGPLYVTYEFCKLGRVFYDAHFRLVYVSAPNEKAAVKKGLKFIKQSLAEDLEDDRQHNT